MRTSFPKLLSIVGLYKCGTSWLLPILCSHPKVVGIPEFDVIRATTGNPKDPFSLRPQPELLESFFGKTPWTSIPKALLKKTEDLSADEAIDIWETHMNKKWRTYDPPSAQNLTTPQSFFALNKHIAATFLDRVRQASSEQVLVDQFLETISSYSCDAQYSVVKAADQVAVFDRLKKLIPNRKCVLIIRDGRDASISALHYRQLMIERGAAWVKQQQKQKGLPELLKAWAVRVRMIRQLIDAGEDIYILRYEDLTYNFHEELYNLLTWLELDASTDLLDHIQEATSFKKKTGRERGRAAKDVLRKGATGEWLEVLSEKEKETAWEISGEALSYFGYSQTGDISHWSRNYLYL